MENQNQDIEADTIPEAKNQKLKSKQADTNEQSLLNKAKHWYRQLPDKKRYLEFITALLTIPVLLTVVIANIQTLQKQKQSDVTVTQTPSSLRDDRPTPGDQKDIGTPSPAAITTSTPSVTPSAQCKKEVGPISIVYPKEGTTTSKDPVCLDISRTGEDYCAVVWSYRINGGNWSDYTDKSICIYGLSAGTKNLELRVKSIVTGDEIILTRTFTVLETTTPTPTSTSSASLNN